MRKQRLGRTGLDISAVTFGGVIVMDETPEDAARYVAAAIERGVNYFDVSPRYGNAEDRLGPALAPYRNDVYLACKTRQRDAAAACDELHASLKKLRTDHFDVYQMHEMTTEEDVDRAFAGGGAIDTLVRAKQEGLIRNIGFSAHSEDVALAALAQFDFDSVMFPMYWAMGINTGWGDRIAARVRETGAGLLAIKTLVHRAWKPGEGRGAFPKSWCKPIDGNDALGVAGMKYGLSKGAATLVPPGNFASFTFMTEHIDACLDAPLTEDEWALLRKVAEAVRAWPIF